jgi:ribosomal protein L40E
MELKEQIKLKMVKKSVNNLAKTEILEKICPYCAQINPLEADKCLNCQALFYEK